MQHVTSNQESSFDLSQLNPRRERRKAESRKLKMHYQLLIILALPLTYLAIFHYLPMYGLVLSFKQFHVTQGILRSPWVGLRYFEQFFRSPMSWRIISNTILLSFYGLIVGFPVPILLAIALNEIRQQTFKKTVQMVTYAPYFISTVVMVGMIYQFMDPRLGILTKVFGAIGLPTGNIIGRAEWFRHIYVWSDVWQHAGYSCIIYLAALSGVSPELYDAAIIDGASKPQRIRYVDLPWIQPTIMIILVLSLGYAMNVGFEKVFLMQNPTNLSKSEIIATYVYKVGLVSANFSFSTAIGFFNSVVNMTLLVTVNAIVRRVFHSALW